MQSRNRQSKESSNEGQEKRTALDSLSGLRRQDTDQGIPGHRAGQFPALLQEMQKRNPYQCGPAENGRERRSTRLTKRQLPKLGKLPFSFYSSFSKASISTALFSRSTVSLSRSASRIARTMGVSVAASSSVQVSTKA